MPRQLTFDLPLREARARGDFFVSASNAAALDALDGWQDWPGGKMVLIGPAGAGKSHLAQVWADMAGAEIIAAPDLATLDPGRYAGRRVALDGADRIAGDDAAERAAFHLHNLVLAEGGRLLVTARSAPLRWGLTLPDLASRMQGSASVAIAAPDEPLLAALLVKLFADRQLDVPPALIPWLTARIDRSFAAARDIVARLDAAALAEGKPVSQSLARRLLEADAAPRLPGTEA